MNDDLVKELTLTGIKNKIQVILQYCEQEGKDRPVLRHNDIQDNSMRLKCPGYFERLLGIARRAYIKTGSAQEFAQ